MIDNTTDNYLENLDKEFTKNIKKYTSGFSINKKIFMGGVSNELTTYHSLYNQHIYPAEAENRIDSRLRKARRPYWRSYTPFGITKNIDTTELRQLGNTWAIQRCKSIIISEALSADFEIVASDKQDFSVETRRKIQMINTFLRAVNREGETFKEALEPFLNDMLDLGMGVMTKGFVKNAYQNIIIDEDKVPQESVYPTGQLTYVPKNAGEGLLRELTTQDSAEFFVQPDTYGTHIGWWQWGYSQAVPTFFSKREIIDIHNFKTSYNPYGLSPVETVKNIVNVLVTSVANMRQYMDDGAIPPGIIVLEKINETEFDVFKSRWDVEVKGNPSEIPVMSAGEQGKLTHVPLVINTADIKQLDTLDVYTKIVMSVFHVTPAELGITDAVNKASAEQQSAVQKRAAIFPLLEKLELLINRHIITEFDPERRIKFQWILPMTIEEETSIFNLDERKLNAGLMTINEYHAMKGNPLVAWGNIPFNIHTWLGIASQQEPSLMGFKDPSTNPNTAKIDLAQRQMLMLIEQMQHMLNNDKEINPRVIDMLTRLKLLRDAMMIEGDLQMPTQSVIESENIIDLLSSNQSFGNTADIFNQFGRDSIREMDEQRKKKALESNTEKGVRSIARFTLKDRRFFLARAFLINHAKDKAMQKKLDKKTDRITDTMESSLGSILKRWYHRIMGHMDNMTEQEHTPEPSQIKEELARAVMFEGFTDMVKDSFKQAYRLGFATNNRGETRSELIKDESVIEAFPEVREVIEERSKLFSDGYLGKYTIDIRRTINEGLAKGQGIRKITRDLKGIIPFEKKEGETNQDFRKRQKRLNAKLKMYARTEVISAMNIGRLNQLKALGATHWEYRTHFDEKTCDKPFLLHGEMVTCKSLHGRTFSIDDARFLPTIHPNCRCGIRAVLNDGKSFDEEFDELFEDYKEAME